MKKQRNPYQKYMWQKGHTVQPDQKKQASKDACRVDIDGPNMWDVDDHFWDVDNDGPNLYDWDADDYFKDVADDR